MRTNSRGTFRGLTGTVSGRAVRMAATVIVAGAMTGGMVAAQDLSRLAAANTRTQDTVATDGTPVGPGRQLYAQHCAACHGESGDGKGIAAAYLFPRPRDFRAGRFRLVSTSNNVPTRDDLHAVLLRGMPGSSMPPWGHLSQKERDALVDEVMRLRIDGARDFYIRILKEEEELTEEEIAEEDIQEEIRDYVERFSTPGESSVVPEFGESTPEVLKAAKAIYASVGCLQCHGKDGKGDGVKKMIDEEGLPTAPRDFTVGVFKGGTDPASLYRRIAYGMPATPMPGSQQLTPEQMMELVHYVRSMSTEQQRQAAVLNRGKLVVKATDTAVAELKDEAWSNIPSVSFRMTPLWWRDNADPGLQVQAIHDGRTLAVRLTWRDDEGDRQAVSGSSFEDAVAMQLYRGNSEPFLGMGGPKSPIDVWFWDADRQGKPRTVEDIYPNVVVDVYPFSEAVATSAEFTRAGARTGAQPDISLPAKASGNQIVPTDDASGGTSLSAVGPGSSTFRIPGNPSVRATGKWQDGRWTVLMTRALALDSANGGVSLEPGSHASVAFAVWDGSEQDRDGKKLITIWQDLVLEK
ncbi:MAG: c-type cytochrome [Fuerstiella sp.]|nr:c-type cytochrome [Fuerstiella sp.]MCP4858979.1 c-type cytochrome [Fuerstiella sp.]